MTGWVEPFTEVLEARKSEPGDDVEGVVAHGAQAGHVRVGPVGSVFDRQVEVVDDG